MCIRMLTSSLAFLLLVSSDAASSFNILFLSSFFMELEMEYTHACVIMLKWQSFSFSCSHNGLWIHTRTRARICGSLNQCHSWKKKKHIFKLSWILLLLLNIFQRPSAVFSIAVVDIWWRASHLYREIFFFFNRWMNFPYYPSIQILGISNICLGKVLELFKRSFRKNEAHLFKIPNLVLTVTSSAFGVRVLHFYKERRLEFHTLFDLFVAGAAVIT